MAAKRARKRASSTTIKKVTRRTSTPATQSIHAVSPAKRKQVLRGVRKVLRDHNVADKLSALHFAPLEAALAEPMACPPHSELRTVCTPDASGTMHCRHVCVPEPIPALG